MGTFPVTVTVTQCQRDAGESRLAFPMRDFAEIEWDADSADLDCDDLRPQG